MDNYEKVQMGVLIALGLFGSILIGAMGFDVVMTIINKYSQ